MRIKVLCFVDGMGQGGIQNFVIEYTKNIDRNKIKIDYLLLDDGREYPLENKLRELGCDIYKLKEVWIEKAFDYISCYRKMNLFFKKHHDYKIVHMHSSSKNFLVLYFAKKYGIKIRIAHSHNIDFQTDSFLKKFIGKIFMVFLRHFATHYFACSRLAAEWMFGKRNTEKGNIKYVHNAINVNRFLFDEIKREKIRDEMHLNECFVVGNIGRFTEQKNHKFLIEIFFAISKKKKNAKLLLIGEGIKRTAIEKKVMEFGLKEAVVFMGEKSNVEDYLQGLDVFVLPSNFEGLGIVLIEAQAAGVPCFTSKYVVPHEVAITKLLHFISLKKSAEEWADIILENQQMKKNTISEIIEAGYSIKKEAKSLEEWYLSV